MKTQPVKTHTIIHIWAAYAAKLLAKNPSYYTRVHNNCSHDSVVYYNDENGKRIEVMSYTRFRRIIEHYFNKAKERIINGEAVSINQCGKICAKRVERDFRQVAKGKKKLPINWAETTKQPLVYSEEKGRMVYSRIIRHTDDDYCRIGWFKPGITNESVYEFLPADANSPLKSAFKPEFIRALNRDPMLKYRFLFCPVKIYSKNKKDGVPINNS